MRNIAKILLFSGSMVFATEVKIPACIQTPRLILRTWTEEDISNLHKMMQNPKVNEFLEIFKLTDFTVVKNLAEKANDNINQKGYGYFVCIEKESGDFMGYIGLNYISLEKDPFPCFTLAWTLNEKFWGKGYAPEAASALIKLAFEKFDIQRLCACTVEGNIKSRKVMEKLGMKYNMTFDFPNIAVEHPHCKHVLYAITRDEYMKTFNLNI